ncbi:hypothetical protein DFJ73DRAFT_870506 [Zopfochytrium polystomum]|nr:hypothetical protein DFJ73DRAFT_870506 [Zopfochytrium polystomum]
MFNLFKQRSKVSAPLMADITVADVEIGGMPRLMVSRIPLAYYLVSLMEDYCSENLFFHLEATFYTASGPSMSPEQLEAHASHIFKTYLEPDSLFEVNVDFKLRKQCQEALESKTDLAKIFELPAKHIFGLLEASYIKFLRGPYAAKLRLEQDGATDIAVTAKSRDEVMAVIVSRLREQGSHGKLVDPEAAEKRAVSLQHMVAEFCRTVLDVPVEKSLEMIRSSKPPAERTNSPRLKKK